MCMAETAAHLRPIERRVLDLRQEGVEVEEIAARFNKSPEFVQRILDWTAIPRTGRTHRQDRLTAMQRRVLELRASGDSHAQIAAKFNKTERFIRQVNGLAHFQEGQRLLSNE